MIRAEPDPFLALALALVHYIYFSKTPRRPLNTRAFSSLASQFSPAGFFVSMARSRSPPLHDDNETSQPDLKRRKKKSWDRLSLAQIQQYARDGLNYLIPRSYNWMTYTVKIGNPPIGRERLHRIRFWQDKFSFDINGENQVWKLDEPQSIPFLKSLKEQELPDVLKGDGEDVVHVIQIFRGGEKGCSAVKKEDQHRIEGIKGFDTCARNEDKYMIENLAVTYDDETEELKYNGNDSELEEWDVNDDVPGHEDDDVSEDEDWED